ncbi:hypothetical protein C8R44DRAFT_883686 [Mycena epipterygia]|nr:hypothetical protein C8R44DRAFT_883686 [Mycena epipterygia]
MHSPRFRHDSLRCLDWLFWLGSATLHYGFLAADRSVPQQTLHFRYVLPTMFHERPLSFTRHRIKYNTPLRITPGRTLNQFAVSCGQSHIHGANTLLCACSRLCANDGGGSSHVSIFISAALLDGGDGHEGLERAKTSSSASSARLRSHGAICIRFPPRRDLRGAQAQNMGNVADEGQVRTKIILIAKKRFDRAINLAWVINEQIHVPQFGLRTALQIIAKNLLRRRGYATPGSKYQTALLQFIKIPTAPGPATTNKPGEKAAPPRTVTHPYTSRSLST